ncbi:hypothetical protein ACN4EK_09920 [Pantanalinema rosaneae CENA516]|uniref:hypothetical protein n=1 Tax=Pantanalinema rosaneae TaxID=1620701 RepID=UPI003D6F5579
MSSNHEPPNYPYSLGITSNRRVNLSRPSQICSWTRGGYPIGYFPDDTVRVFTLFDPSTTQEEMSPYVKTTETPDGKHVIYQWGYTFSL